MISNTATEARPDAVPAVAVIVAVPLAMAVTSPDPSTDATDASLLDHETETSVITWALWSSTFARSCTVAPRANSSVSWGTTETTTGRGGSGGGGSVAPSPQA